MAEKTVPLRELFDIALKKQNHKVHKPKKRKQWTNKSGFYKVQKMKCKACRQGFTWAYRVQTSNGEHKISRTDLLRLKKDITDMGLKWFVIDEEKAKKTAKESNHELDILR